MNDTYDQAIAAARALQAPLSARLAAVHDADRRLAPDYDAAVDRFVARIAKAASAAPDVGDAFPPFILPDHWGKLRALHALWAEGPLVIAVLRGVWCPYCRVTLAALAEAAPGIRAAGGSIVAIAPQRAAWGAAHAADSGADFPILSDPGGGAAALIGLSVFFGDDLLAALRAEDVDLSEINGDDGALAPIPATFVVGPDGRIAARFVDPDPRRRMEIEAIFAAVSQAASHAASQATVR